MNRWKTVGIPFTIAVFATVAFSQNAAEPAFDLVSVRLTRFLPRQGTAFLIEPGRLSCANCTLQRMLTEAYRIPMWRFISPPWLVSYQSVTTVYQLAAGFPMAARNLVPAMMRRMLKERFHAITHVVSLDTPVYVLRLAPGGLMKLKPHDPPRVPVQHGDARPREDLPRPADENFNTSVLRLHGPMSLGYLASALSTAMDRDVVDQTGLAGEFDMLLDARIPAMRQLPAGTPAIPHTGDSDPAVRNLPSVLSEIQKLGLTLEPAVVPLDYLVVVRIDRVPADN